MQENAVILNELQAIMNVPISELIERVEALIKDKKQLEKKVKNRKKGDENLNLLKGVESIGEYSLLIKSVLIENQSEIKVLGDQLFEKIGNGIGVLFNNTLEKSVAVIVVSKKLNSKNIFAGKLANKIGKLMDGGGGGKPHLATAGGKKNISLEKTMMESKRILVNILNGL
jgi:alanyl-tRNA synthetase